MAWLISNLSETYTNTAVFDLNFVGIPQDQMLTSASKQNMYVKLEALGFQFLGFNFENKKINIDVSKAFEYNGKSIIPSQQLKKQMERQLSGSMRIVEMARDTLYLNFKDIVSKTVPIDVKVKMEFRQNYILTDSLEIRPKEVVVTGVEEELEAISILHTEKLHLSDLSENFEYTLNINKPEGLTSIQLSNETILIRGEVVKFSEKIVEVPIQVINLPEAVNMRTFPEKVSVLCKAKLDVLKDIKPTDFRITVDYNNLAENKETNLISVFLQEIPETVYDATLLQNKVEYILQSR